MSRAPRLTKSFKGSVSKTIQGKRAEHDINVMVGRFTEAGGIPEPVNPAFYGDSTQLPDFAQSMQRVAAVTATFNDLRSHVRAAFGNRPEHMIECLTAAMDGDPDAMKKAKSLGLLHARTPDPAPAPHPASDSSLPDPGEAQAPEPESDTPPPDSSESESHAE